MKESSSLKSQKSMKWWNTPAAQRTGMICLGISVFGLLLWWFHYRPYVSTDDARVSMTLIRVAPEGAGGRVVQLNAQEGDQIKKGFTLVELDHRNAEAQLSRIRARANLAQHELKRVEELAKQNGVPARDLDKARAEAQTTEAEVHLAEVALENTYIKSQIDGVVVQKVSEVGNLLEPGQVALTLADSENAWVSANIEETYISNVKLGQKVSIGVDEGGELQGTVSEIRRAAASQFALIPSENASGNFTKLVQRIPIKIKLEPHPDLSLRAGQSVEIRIRVTGK